MRIAVLGLGYVGSVTAACLAGEGLDVVGVDANGEKVADMAAGRSPIIEPGLEEKVAAAVASGCLTATTDLEAALDDCDVAIVCVGTPSRYNGSLDLSQVQRVTQQIAGARRSAGRRLIVLYRSTILPGTTEKILQPLLEGTEAPHPRPAVAFVPEFLREGSALMDFYNPPYTVLGVQDDGTADALRELFGFLTAPTHVVTIPTAEALKYACNAFHALKVTFANEFARFAHACGVESREVMDLLCQDRELNISARYLRPGFAFGGSCLPKDLRALTHLGRSALDEDLPLLNSLLLSNAQHVQRAVDQVLSTEARRVTLLGLSFKQGTDDLRESPYVSLAEALIGKGIELRIYDPIVNLDRLVGANRRYLTERLPHVARNLSADLDDVLRDAECVVVAQADAEVLRAVSRLEVPVIDLTGGAAADLPAVTGLAW